MPDWAHRAYWKKSPTSGKSKDTAQNISPNVGLSSGHGTTSTTKAELITSNSPDQLPVVDAKLPSRLAQVTEDLRIASEALQKTLNGRHTKPADTLVDVYLNIERDDAPPPLPFSVAVRAAHIQKDAKGKTLKGQTANFLATLYPALKLALGLTGSISSSAGFMPLQVTANGLAQVLEILVEPRSRDAQVMDALDDLTRDEQFLVSIRRLPEEALDENFRLDVLEVTRAMNVFLNDSIRYLDRHYALKLLRSVVGIENVDESKELLAKARKGLWRATKEKAEFITISRALRDEQIEILDKICPKDLVAFHYDKQTDLHKRRLPNSAAWFMADSRFISWRDTEVETLWCPGLPGAGKTYTSSAIIDHIDRLFEDRNIGLAYVFFEFSLRSESFERKLDSTLRAIVRQLLARKPTLCHHFEDLRRKKHFDVEDCHDAFVRLSKLFQSMAVVIDALDEFSEVHSERVGLIKALVRVQRLIGRGKLRLLITSREMSGIPEILGVDQGQEIPVRGDSVDIQAMIKKHFKMSDFSNDMELEYEVTQEILDRSDCIFKLAELQLKSVLSDDLLNRVQVQKRLKLLSKEIFDYYTEDIRRISSTKEGTIIIKMLTWLQFALQPTHVDELTIALSIDEQCEVVDNSALGFANFERFIAASRGLIVTRQDMYHPALRKRDRIHQTFRGDLVETPYVERTRLSFAHETVMAFFHQHPELLHLKRQYMIADFCVRFISSDPWLQLLRTIPQSQFMDFTENERLEKLLQYTDEIGIERSLIMVEATSRKYDKGPTSSGNSLKRTQYSFHPNIRFFRLALCCGDYTPFDDFETADEARPLRELLRKLSVAGESPSRLLFGPECWIASHGWTSVCRWFIDSGLATLINTTEDLLPLLPLSSAKDEVSQMFTSSVFGAWLECAKTHPDLAVKRLNRALHIACESGWSECVKDMLSMAESEKQKIKLRHVPEYVWRDLWKARTQLPCLRCLAESDSIDLEDDATHGVEFLYMAAALDLDGTVLNALLRRKDLDFGARYVGPWLPWFVVRNPPTLSPFMAAVVNRNPITVRTLLSSGICDLRAGCVMGLNMIGFAIASAGWVSDHDSFGDFEAERAQSEGAFDGNALRTFRELLAHPTLNINEQDERGRTALSWAASGSTFLEKPSSTLMAIGKTRPSKTHVAILMRLLAIQEADLNLPDWDGNTPLDYAYFALHQAQRQVRRDWVYDKSWHDKGRLPWMDPLSTEPVNTSAYEEETIPVDGLSGSESDHDESITVKRKRFYRYRKLQAMIFKFMIRALENSGAERGRQLQNVKTPLDSASTSNLI